MTLITKPPMMHEILFRTILQLIYDTRRVAPTLPKNTGYAMYHIYASSLFGLS